MVDGRPSHEVRGETPPHDSGDADEGQNRPQNEPTLLPTLRIDAGAEHAPLRVADPTTRIARLPPAS